MDVRDLPTLNAVLNTTASVLLVWGWIAIRQRRIALHRRAPARFVFSGRGRFAQSIRRSSERTRCWPPPSRSSRL
jgi:hypothetical protein